MVIVLLPARSPQPDFHRPTSRYFTKNHNLCLLPRDCGVIVQVGSVLAYRGITLQAAYCAAKHAIQGFPDAPRCEFLHDNSHVKVVEAQMPRLNTPQFSWVKSRLPRKPQPVPPIFQSEVAAEGRASTPCGDLCWLADCQGYRQQQTAPRLNGLRFLVFM